ncbi:folate-binding protein [Actimicrobium antarcticum]|uniref:Folate-binding protein YgfZ n=1 Tax=Actimicrobium antarcticum TaxID=1051899 RepID=A0ABP7SGX6_9BURK
MTDWHQFIASQTTTSNATGVSGKGFFSALTDLGLMACSGDDAANFLHNQLTNDVEHLTLDEARLAGYCTPKGRLLASFLMWRSADSVMLEVSRDIQATVQKRLQMFVMRAKAKITDATDAFVILGLGGAAVAPVLAQWFPVVPAVPFGKVDTDAGTLVRVADAAGVPRYQWITSPAIALSAWPALDAGLEFASPEAWRLSEITAAIPHITLPTQEKFVPQMINFEAIGGVNFKKGCYPGQEIVARSQYLGKLKRRMLPASVSAAEAVAGMEVYADKDAEQPCGMIVNAARDHDGVYHCLIEIKTAALDGDNIRLGLNGAVLHFSALPYALPDTV